MEIQKIWADYMLTYLTPEEKLLAQSFEAHYASYLKNGIKPALLALTSRDLPQAQTLLAATIGPLFKEVHADMNALIKLQKDVAKIELDDATRRDAVLTATSLASIVFGLCFAMWFGWLLTQSPRIPGKSRNCGINQSKFYAAPPVGQFSVGINKLCQKFENAGRANGTATCRALAIDIAGMWVKVREEILTHLGQASG